MITIKLFLTVGKITNKIIRTLINPVKYIAIYIRLILNSDKFITCLRKINKSFIIRISKITVFYGRNSAPVVSAALLKIGFNKQKY